MKYQTFTTAAQASEYLLASKARGHSGYVLKLNATTFEVRTW